MALFKVTDRHAVIAALERCRPGRDHARVHRAVLSLSFGNLREVERLVEMASNDHREVLHMAETASGMVFGYGRLGLRLPVAAKRPF